MLLLKLKADGLAPTMDHFEIFRHFGVQTSTISPSVGMMVLLMNPA